MDGFTLNGLRSDTDLGIVMGQVVKPIAPTLSVVTEDVPAKYGVNYEGTNYQAKTITIPYTVLNYDSQDSFNSAIQNLAAQLIRPELGSQEYALVFDDEPNKTYIGHVSAIDAPTFTNTGVYDFSGNITFEMSDPRAYLPLVELPIDNRANRSDNLLKNTSDLSKIHIDDNADGVTNLVYNSEYDNNADGWNTFGNGYPSSKPSDMYNGSQGLGVNISGKGTDAWTGIGESKHYDVSTFSTSSLFSFSAMVKIYEHSPEASVLVTLSFFDSSGNRITWQDVTVKNAASDDNSTIWQKASFDGCSYPAGAATVALQCWVHGDTMHCMVAQPIITQTSANVPYRADAENAKGDISSLNHTTSGNSVTITNSDKSVINLYPIDGYNFQVNQSVTIAVDASCTGTASIVFGYFDGASWNKDSQQFPLTGTTQRIIFSRVLSSVNGNPHFSVTVLCKNGTATVGSIKLATDEDDGSLPDMAWSPATGENGYYNYTSGYDVTVDGTAPADPVLSIIPKRDLNHAGFMLNGGNFGVGTDDDVQQPNVQSPYTEIIEDNAGSISEWSNDTGATSGITTATGFVAQSSMAASTDGSSVLNVARNKDGTFDFGSLQNSGWYGPLYRYQGISASLPYYKISAMIHHKIYTGIHNLRAMGDIEFLLLDGNGQSFGRFAIKSQSGGHVPYAIMQIGTSGSRFSSDSDHYTLYNGKGVNFTDKRNVKVKLPTTIKTGKKKRIKYIKVVNAENTSALTDAWLEFTLEHTVKNGVPVFNWSITQYNLKTGLPYQDKRKHLIVSGQYVDSGNRFCSSLGSVGLGMWKMAITEDTTTPAIPYRNCYMSLTEMSIYQVNQTQLEPTKPKQIAKAGQELILDCAADRATVDGHEISPTWTTTFPKFKPGVNEIALAGDIADADITLSYYPRTY